MKMRSIISLMLCLCLTAAVLAGCGGNASKPTENVTEAATAAETKTDGIDYMVLVNKTHKLPDDWEEKLETVHMTNSVGDDVETEKKAYDAYLKLKAIQEQNPDSKYTQIVEFLMTSILPRIRATRPLSLTATTPIISGGWRAPQTPAGRSSASATEHKRVCSFGVVISL